MNASAQQLTLDWATPVVAQNQRVKLASNGDVFAFGTAANAAQLQRLDAAGTVLWTMELAAPQARAVDMDIDADDNLYLLLCFASGQLDLDPGAQATLVDAGRVYAKYTGDGAFQWGFGLADPSAADDESGLSVTDAGDLYVCGSLGTGTYDFDPTAGTDVHVVPAAASGSYIARYHTDGTLAWANLESWPGGNSTARDIAAMDDGSGFYVVRNLDTDGPPSGQVDVDPGPGVFNTAQNNQGILRFDSDLHFMAHMYNNYNALRLTTDATGALYLLGYYTNGAIAGKYTTTGTAFNTVYSNDLPDFNNLRIGEVVADGTGGCIGMYNLNCVTSTVRFYKLNSAGTPDFNFMLDSGTDCTMPGARGFDMRGGNLYVGTYNENYPIDLDPGPGTLLLPSGDDDGVVAKYAWCIAGPNAPVDLASADPLCTGTEVSFTVVDAHADLTYTWTAPGEWTIVGGQGTDTLLVRTDTPGIATLLVSAANACGSSAPVFEAFNFTQTPALDLGPDVVICPGDPTLLSAPDGADSYLWQPTGLTTASITVAPSTTTTYQLTMTTTGCAAVDNIIVEVEICTGIGEEQETPVRLWPVPVPPGGSLQVEGLGVEVPSRLFGSDGRAWPLRMVQRVDGVLIDVSHLPTGPYILRTARGRAFVFSVAE